MSTSKNFEQVTPERVEELFGSFNDFPAGFREIDEKTLVQDTNFQRVAPVHVEYRQMHHKGELEGVKRKLFATLYFFHDGTGVAIETSYWGFGYYRNEPEEYTGKHVKFYVFGCDHDYRPATQEERQAHNFCGWPGMHAYTCNHCGHYYAVDSSD